jgi:hypothetical protein
MDNINVLWRQLLFDYVATHDRLKKTVADYPGFVAAINPLITMCKGAIDSVVNSEYTVDGGYPYTQAVDIEMDCNGGYPGL